MNRHCILSAVLFLVLLTASAFAEVVQSDWKPLFVGVDHATGRTSGESDRPLQKVNAIRVDLNAPGISFIATPQRGSNETIRQTASEFLDEQDAQIAVNANFFASDGPYYQQGTADLRGLAVTDGQVVSPAEDGLSAALIVSIENTASLVTANRSFDATDVQTAIAGSRFILIDGQVPPDAATDTQRHPRTAIGLSADSRYLYIVTIDGRQRDVSVGASYAELAEWLARFGADDAINLDGGGSTALVRDDGTGTPALLNTPSGHPPTYPIGTERYNGNHLGIRAEPLP